MNRLKTSALMIALALLLTVSVTAVAEEAALCPLGQGNEPGMMGQGPHQMGLMGRLGEELGLTDEQKAEIRVIMAEELPAARQRIEERVSGVLTAEQQSKLEELKEDRPAMTRRGKGPGMGRGMRGQGGPGHPGARLARMAEALELTDDQKTAVREIFTEARQQKRDEVQEKINALLTQEQQEKMETMREQRRERMDERRGALDEQAW